MFAISVGGKLENKLKMQRKELKDWKKKFSGKRKQNNKTKR